LQVIGFPGPTSLAEVHSGRYSVLAYFAETDRENDDGAQAET
jgi:gluconate 2-dehydrogenase gamma chain